MKAPALAVAGLFPDLPPIPASDDTTFARGDRIRCRACRVIQPAGEFTDGGHGARPYVTCYGCRRARANEAAAGETEKR